MNFEILIIEGAVIWPMEEVLKGLQGKTLTKKTLFDFLASINLEDLLRMAMFLIQLITQKKKLK